MNFAVDAIESTLAALLAAPDQATRLLKLHTPLGEGVLVPARATVRECVFGMEAETGARAADDLCGYRVEIEAVSVDAHLALDALIGRPVLLELLTQASRSALRPFHGQVTQFALAGSDGGLARYRLVVEPWLAFLRWRTDSYVFQDLSVLDVLENVFADYQAQGALDVQWRIAVAERARYRPISLVTQYRESDLAFVRRLAAQEGLAFWFEHAGDPDAEPFGAHTLVIADRNDAFAPGAQPRVRYARAGAVIAEDALQGWHESASAIPTGVAFGSRDYRTLEQRSAEAGRADAGDDAPAAELGGTLEDHPGLYAATDADDAQRYARQQYEALAARAALVTAAGTVRALAPATTFALADHAQIDPATSWAVLAVAHEARNNLGAAEAGGTQEPLYRQRAVLLDAAVPYRALLADGSGARLHPKPTVRGTQTAIVAGRPGEPVTTDRDHRVKVQFAWTRGAASASRQAHPSGADDAPANDTAGTWVRVAEPLAGANWGGHFVPRSGQEVLVAFLEGDIDRPVIVGALYNGQGADDAQSNRIGQGAGGATPNGPAWFPGSADAHAHDAVLAGLKTQALDASQSGTGGYNQLVFDATPGKARVSLATTQAASGLHLGHLRTQNDNRLVADRGHGGELTTEAQGALRAGAGLLVSADARGEDAALHDAAEAIAQLQQARSLAGTLAQTAQHQGAGLPGETAPERLPALAAQAQAIEDLQATETRGASAGAAINDNDDAHAIRAIEGGAGTVPAWAKPHLVLSAPAGIGMFTPASQTWAAGQTLHLSAAEDIGLAAGGELRVAVKEGLSLFTHGGQPAADRPEQTTGIRLHAATGRVSVQAQSGAAELAARRDVAVQSTNASLLASAPEHQLLTAQGAYIRLQGGNIEVHAPGSVAFHASQKNWTGPQSAGEEQVTLNKAKDLLDEQFVLIDELSGQPLAGEPYHVVDDASTVVAQGITGPQGETPRYTSTRASRLMLRRGSPD